LFSVFTAAGENRVRDGGSVRDILKSFHKPMTFSEDSAFDIEVPSVSRERSARGAVRDPGELVILLFDQLQGRLLSYVLSFGLSFHDAEDILQEAFLSLFRHLQLDRPQVNLRGWLFRVVHNLALKRRSANRMSETHAEFDDLVARQEDPAPAADELLEISRRQKRFLAVLSALPEQDRRCLILRAEGLKYREIAELTGISLGAVSISLSRSLERLARSERR
jgi:RNA polymerase sigma-70 factor (ECF subfamily)